MLEKIRPQRFEFTHEDGKPGAFLWERPKFSEIAQARAEVAEAAARYRSTELGKRTAQLAVGDELPDDERANIPPEDFKVLEEYMQAGVLICTAFIVGYEVEGKAQDWTPEEIQQALLADLPTFLPVLQAMRNEILFPARWNNDAKRATPAALTS